MTIELVPARAARQNAVESAARQTSPSGHDFASMLAAARETGRPGQGEQVGRPPEPDSPPAPEERRPEFDLDEDEPAGLAPDAPSRREEELQAAAGVAAPASPPADSPQKTDGEGNLPVEGTAEPASQPALASGVSAAGGSEGSLEPPAAAGAQPAAPAPNSLAAASAGTAAAELAASAEPSSEAAAPPAGSALNGADPSSAGKSLDPATDVPAPVVTAPAETASTGAGSAQGQRAASGTAAHSSAEAALQNIELADKVSPGAAFQVSGAVQAQGQFGAAEGDLETAVPQPGRKPAAGPAEDPAVSNLAQGPKAQPPSPALSSPDPARLAEARSTSLARQVSLGIENLAHTGGRSLLLHLNPEELGRISLRFLTTQEGLAVNITADRQLTGALLESQLDDLRQSLAEAGVQLSGLSMGPESAQGDDARGMTPNRHGRGQPHGARRMNPLSAGEHLPDALNVRRPRDYSSDGSSGVDVRV